jgi:hypothetical protein
VNRYYVYRLIDPRDGQPFYIGKGTGRRMHQHVSEARARRLGNSTKHLRILEIETAGFEVEHEVMQDGLSEPEAYRLENHLIATTPGLTNIAPGTNPDAARQRALLLLRTVKDPVVWLNERQRSLKDMELYRAVVLGLMDLARPLKPSNP